MSIFGSHTKLPKPAIPSILNSIRIQRSDYGSVVPIVFGQNRVAGKLMWYGDFTPVPHTSSQAVGGKGGGGNRNSTTSTTYTYKAATAVLLCEGPIQGLYNVWDSKGKLAQQSVTENYTVPSGGGTYTVGQAANFYDDFGVGRADTYSVGANDYGDVPRTYSGTYKSRVTKVSTLTGAGQYKYLGAGQYQFHTADTGKVMSITYQYNVPDSTSSGQPSTVLALSLFLGNLSQTPWGYLTTNHPTQAIGYSNMAYVASQALDLGSQGSLPNYTYEVVGLKPYGAGITDANPADVISTLLTDVRLGCGIPSSYVGSLTQYSNYCIANGLFISPVIDSQRAARDIIQEFLDATNSATYWSEGVQKFVPYGDTTVVGNGVVYTPATSPVVDLTDDNFVDTSNPIVISRTSAQDAYNSVRVDWTNRSNSYNSEPVEEKDDGAIALYGFRPDTASASYPFITTLLAATFAANTKLKRNVYIRKQYKFKVGFQFCFLEPMDLVTLTDSKLGYSKVPCRITQIDEDADTGVLDITAEEFPWGTATATLYSKQQPTSFAAADDVDPGNVNAPIIFEASNRLAKYSGREVWMAVSGAPSTWGGCEVWVSIDNTNYKQIGLISGAARMGVLSASLPATADPDSTDTLGVDLTSSGGTLSSGSADDCNNFRTLCYIDGELISYQTATLVSANKYNLGTLLRRGVFGTTPLSHSSGTAFARLDDAIFIFQYDPTYDGKLVYFKFVSFNKKGLKRQNIASLSPTTFTIPGSAKGAVDSSTGAIQVGTASSSVALIDSAQTKANAALIDGSTLVNTIKVSGQARTVYDAITLSNGGVGQNLAENPSFELGPSPGTGDIVAGYYQGNSQITWVQQAGGVFTFSGTYVAYASIPAHTSLPVGSFNGTMNGRRNVQVKVGDTIVLRAKARLDQSVGTPAGITFSCNVGVQFLFSDGTTANFFTTNASMGAGWQTITLTMKVPANNGGSQTPVSAIVFLSHLVSNSNGSAVDSGAGLVADFRVDNVELIKVTDGSTDELLKIGSVPPTYSGTLSYTSTTTSITWSWSLSILRTDSAMSTTSASGSQAVTGLSSGTTYNHYPFYDEGSLSGVPGVNMVKTGGVGTPSWAHSGTSAAWTQEQSRGDHAPLSTSPVAGSTTTSGSGGGSGGGSGFCLAETLFAKELTKGVVRLSQLEDGDFLWSEGDQWLEIAHVSKRPCSLWVEAEFNCGQTALSTPGHRWQLIDGKLIPAEEFSLLSEIPCSTGITAPQGIRLSRVELDAVKIRLKESPNTFYVASDPDKPWLLTHNVILGT